MKKLYTLFLALSAVFILAQVPQAFAYQAVAFNASGSPVVNGTVSVRVSILNDSATGSNLYTETHSMTTNSKGLINLNIGKGVAVSGSFSEINWGVNSKFIKVEMDPAGGNNYSNVGTNQLMSVPYAMLAKKIDVSSSDSSIGDDVIENKSVNYAFVDKYDRKVYAFNARTGIWSSQSYSINYYNNGIIPVVTSSNGNFIFIDKYDNKTYVFNSKTGTWISQIFSVNYSNNSIIPNLVTTTNGNVMFIDKYEHKVNVFNYVSGTWMSQSYNVNYSNNNILPEVISSGSNLAFIDKYDHKMYVFNAKTTEWKAQVFSVNYLNMSFLPDVTSSNGNFIFTDKYEHKVFVFNSKTGNWTSQGFSVNYSNNNILPVTVLSETN